MYWKVALRTSLFWQHTELDIWRNLPRLRHIKILDKIFKNIHLSESLKLWVRSETTRNILRYELWGQHVCREPLLNNENLGHMIALPHLTIREVRKCVQLCAREKSNNNYFNLSKHFWIWSPWTLHTVSDWRCHW